MKVFKNIRFYLGAVLVLFFAVGLSACGEGTKENTFAIDEATGKAIAAHGMIFDKDDTEKEKRRKIEEYFKARYEGTGKAQGKEEAIMMGIRFLSDGSLRSVEMSADFTPPEFVAKEGASEEEDLRARALAFLKAEEKSLGLDKLQGELKESEEGISVYGGGDVPVLKDVKHYMEVEGVPVRGLKFIFYFIDGEPSGVSIKFAH